PCVIESRDHALFLAEKIAEIARKAGFPYIFKASFDKANRSSVSSYRGPGMDEGLAVLAEVREKIGVPVLTDIHTEDQMEPVAQAVDILQIPAFLCRQTDFLLAAARTGKPVNVKKGQFLAPWDMKNVIAKITGAGNAKVLVTERGASFGYNTLVVDMTGLPVLASFGAPVVIDATHAVQKPGGQGTSSGGNREMAPYIARAAVAAGVAGVFIEVHEDPDHAPSDGPNMLDIKTVPALLDDLIAIDAIIKRKR
ncbi:MAG TPA: 3-deoxy-8-phosphooctulonate synthase, partial [Rhizomicrobium sp.]|nr:3-deoxy-8-phosphooctulonate synthase [Rhizomicrobium sp.]